MNEPENSNSLLHTKQKELDQLTDKVLEDAKKDESRRFRQSEVFHRFMNRPLKQLNSDDHRIMDIIDMYEYKLADIRKQVRHSHTRSDITDPTYSDGMFSASQKYKAMLQTYECHLIEKDEIIKKLQNQIRNHSIDTNNTSSPCDLSKIKVSNLSRESGGQVFKQISENQCRAILETIASDLSVNDPRTLRQEVITLKAKLYDFAAYYQFAQDVSAIVRRYGKHSGEMALHEVARCLKHWGRQLQKENKIEDINSSQLVKDIQTLFDVKEVSSLYCHLTYVFNRFQMFQNVYKTLRSTLGLDECGGCHMVVEAVELLKESNDNHLGALLHTDELVRIRSMINEYNDFFPKFHKLVEDLMVTFNVDHIDEILPAARSLKI